MKALISIFLLSPLFAFAQKVAMQYDGTAKFQTVIEVEGTAADLYKAVNRWIAKTYKSHGEVVRASVENEEVRGDGFEPNGLLIVKAPTVRNGFRYSFIIEVKENKIRYTMYDMRGDSSPVEAYIYKKDGTERTSGQAEAVKGSATEAANKIIDSLRNSLLNKGRGEDW